MYKKRRLLSFVVAISFIATSLIGAGVVPLPIIFETELVANASSDEMVLNAVIRDFKARDEDGGHPDFQVGGVGLVTGLVEDTLNSDKKPVLTSNDSVRDDGRIQSAESFSQWYTDVPGVNLRKDIEIVLEKQSDGTYAYDDSSFFPIDGKLFGNYSWNNYAHNFHFTTEIATQFSFQGDETFTFRGDDDVWVFINDRLAADIGGVHGPISRTIDLSDSNVRDSLNISPGNTYELRIFHAERQTVGSNFRIETTLALHPVESPLDVERNLNKDEYNAGEVGDLTYTFSSSDIPAFEEVYAEMGPADIVLVVDLSGSMNWTGTENVPRLVHAKEAANNFVDNFEGEDVRIGIVGYSTRAWEIKGLTHVDNSTSIKNAINAMEAAGLTNTGDGYRLGYHMLENGRENASKHVVLMTDGETNGWTEVGGNFYEGDTVFSNNNNVISGNSTKADDYIRLFGEKSRNAGFNNFLIGFHLNSTVQGRLRDIADAIGGFCYSANSGEALSGVYEEISSAIASTQEYFYEEIYMEDTLPEGVKPVVLPSGFSSRRNDDGTYTVTMSIPSVQLNNVGEDLFRLPQFSRQIRVQYVTGGNKNYGDISVSFKNHQGEDDAGESTNSPGSFANSDLVEISRTVKGSPLYELDMLGDGKTGVEDNDVSNRGVAAKDERGRIDYKIEPIHKVTAFEDVGSFGVNITETLPVGVKAIESELPSGLSQSISGNSYVVSGTINANLEDDAYGDNTYKTAEQQFSIPVKFNSIGEKTFNNLTASYNHVAEGNKSANVDGTDIIRVFDVNIEDIEIKNDTGGKYMLVFRPSFADNIGAVTINNLKVNGEGRQLYQSECGNNLEVRGIELETPEILITGTGAGQAVGFKVDVPVYDFDVDVEYVEAFVGDYVSQEIKLDGNIDVLEDVSNVDFDLGVDVSNQNETKQNDNTVALEYTIEEEINPKTNRLLRLDYRLPNTTITKEKTFEILAITDLLSLEREFAGNKFYELDIIGDGVIDFENSISNKKTVAKDQPGRINYKLSSDIVVYENTDSFTATFEEELPEGVEVIVDEVPSAGITVNDDGDGYEVEITVEFDELGDGGHQVKDKTISIPVIFSSTGTKELSDTVIKYLYIDDEREDVAGDASVDVFDVEISKVTLDDDSNVIFTPNLGGVQDNLGIEKINDNGKIVLEDIGIGRKGFKFEGERNGETVGFKIDIPVFSTAPENVVGVSGRAISQRITLEGPFEEEPPLDLKTDTVDEKHIIQNLDIEIQIDEGDEGINSITGEEIEKLEKQELDGNNYKYRIRHRYEAPSKIGEDTPKIDVTYLTELDIPIIRKNIFTQVLVEESEAH